MDVGSKSHAKFQFRYPHRSCCKRLTYQRLPWNNPTFNRLAKTSAMGHQKRDALANVVKFF